MNDDDFKKRTPYPMIKTRNSLFDGPGSKNPIIDAVSWELTKGKLGQMYNVEKAVRLTRKPRKSPHNKTELRLLQSKIKRANADYFNKGGSSISDGEYDALVSRLRRLNPEDKLLSQVGDIPAESKVRLPVSMPSLPKIHSDRDTSERWIEKHAGGRVIVSDKLDGVSALYFKDDKGESKLYTRGNGTTGSDISHLILKVRGLNPLRKGEQMRGELVMTKKRFTETYSNDFANSRNLVSGVVNSRKKISASTKHITFIVHEIIKPAKDLKQAKSSLRNRKFFVVPFKVFTNPTLTELISYMSSRKSKSKIELDGVVLDASGEKVALKGSDEAVIVEVKRVEWNVSQYGTLKPTIVFKKPPTLSGAKISKATGHNAKFIVDNGIGPGAKVMLIRSGDVIPKVTGVIKKARKAQLPTRDYKWKSGTDIISIDSVDDIPKKTKILIRFLVTLGVDKVKFKTLLPAVEDGVIESMEDLIKTDENKLRGAGVGNASSTQIVLGLRKALKEVSHEDMMVATGFFGEGLGHRKIKPLLVTVPPKILLKKSVTPNQIFKLALETKGIGQSNARSFADGVLEYRRFLKKIKWKPTRQNRQGKLVGKSFAFTGYRSREAEALIKKMGGEVIGVTKTTTYLVSNSSFLSGKVRKAKQYGLKIITPKQLDALLLEASREVIKR